MQSVRRALTCKPTTAITTPLEIIEYPLTLVLEIPARETPPRSGGTELEGMKFEQTRWQHQHLAEIYSPRAVKRSLALPVRMRNKSSHAR